MIGFSFPEEKPKSKKGNKPSPTAAADVKIDASRLDMRVGHIVSAIKHPNADRLFVEDVNVGEEKNRTVVSGLAGKIPLEEVSVKELNLYFEFYRQYPPFHVVQHLCFLKFSNILSVLDNVTIS